MYHPKSGKPMPPDFPDREEYIKFINYLDDLSKKSEKNVDKQDEEEFGASSESQNEDIQLIGHIISGDLNNILEDFPIKNAILIPPSLDDYKYFFNNLTDEQLKYWLEKAANIEISSLESDEKLSLTNAVKLAKSMLNMNNSPLDSDDSTDLSLANADYSMAENYTVSHVAGMITDNPYEVLSEARRPNYNFTSDFYLGEDGDDLFMAIVEITQFYDSEGEYQPEHWDMDYEVEEFFLRKDPNTYNQNSLGSVEEFKDDNGIDWILIKNPGKYLEKVPVHIRSKALEWLEKEIEEAVVRTNRDIDKGEHPNDPVWD